MPKYTTFEAWVCIDDVRLEEYDVQETVNSKGTQIVTCWIASEAEREFSVHTKKTRTILRSLLISTYAIDGVRIVSTLSDEHSRDDDIGKDDVEGSLRSIPTTNGERHLCFAPLPLTEDDNASNSDDPNLGSISVQFTRAHYLGPKMSEPQMGTPNDPISLHVGSVHERSKKAGIHHTQLGSLSKKSPRSPVFRRTDTTGFPIVEFIFQYRPLAILQANQIAPAPVPAPEMRLPSATVVDREVETTAEPTEIVVKEEEQAHELGHEDTQNQSTQPPLEVRNEETSNASSRITDTPSPPFVESPPQTDSTSTPFVKRERPLSSPLPILNSTPGSSTQTELTSASSLNPIPRKRRGRSPSMQPVEKRPKVEHVDDSDALHAAERKIEKLAAQREVAEAEMRIAKLRLEEIEAKELVTKLKGKQPVQARAPSAAPEWYIDESGAIVVD